MKKFVRKVSHKKCNGVRFDAVHKEIAISDFLRLKNFGA